MSHVRWFLKEGYVCNLQPHYHAAGAGDRCDQQAVYEYARQVFDSDALRSVIDVGCGGGAKLAAFWPETLTLGIDHGPNIERCRRQHPQRAWQTCDLEREEITPLCADWDRRLVICADVVEHLCDPSRLLASIRTTTQRGAIWVISTPERDLCRGRYDLGPPANPCHVREWNLGEFYELISAYGTIRHAQLVPWRPDAVRAETVLLRVEGG